MVRRYSVALFVSSWRGGIVPGSAGLGGCWSLVIRWCGAVPRGLLVFPLVFPGRKAVLDLCSVGPGFPWDGVRGMGMSQPGGRGGVVPWCAGPPFNGHRGARSAACPLGAGVLQSSCGALWW